MKNAMFWTTEDGRKLHITEMEDGHLVNTIAYLRRRAPCKFDDEKHALPAPMPAALRPYTGLTPTKPWKSFVDDNGRVDYEAFLLARSAQYPNLLAEAARRKLTIPEADWSDETITVLLAQHALRKTT